MSATDDIRSAKDIRISADGVLLMEMRGFSLQRGRITFLFGESGIGKTLMSRAVYGLLDPNDLDVVINGRPYEDYLGSTEVRNLQRAGFFVFQEPSSHLNPLMTLREQISEGALAGGQTDDEILHGLWQGTHPDEVESILSVYPQPFRPSGGEKQRILLAMALKKIDMLISGDPRTQSALFVFDEPSGSLDNRYRDVFLSLLFERHARTPFTALVITHDYSMLSRIMDAHRQLLSSMEFRELSRGRGGLQLADFAPDLYTGWIHALRDAGAPEAHTVTASPLLEIQPELDVLGRGLVITRQRAEHRPSPLVLRPGSMVYLKAPSGTGKTSVVKRVMGLLPGGRFEATLDGMHLTAATPRSYWLRHIWGKRMTMVFQHADEALNPQATVWETFAGLPVSHTRSTEGIIRLLTELFDADEVGDLLDKKVHILSGGQKQRINLLRGLALDTPVLILDEPLNGLGFDSVTRVIAMLRRKLEEGKGILVVSHNEEIFDALVRPDDVYFLLQDTGGYIRSLNVSHVDV